MIHYTVYLKKQMFCNINDSFVLTFEERFKILLAASSIGVAARTTSPSSPSS